MIKIYGIKTCGSVKKAFAFFKDHNIDYEFVDFKKDQQDNAKIAQWVKLAGIDVVLNKKGTSYRTAGLSKLELTDEQKIEYMSQTNLLIKRPVIEYKNELIVGFDEERYTNTFTN